MKGILVAAVLLWCCAAPAAWAGCAVTPATADKGAYEARSYLVTFSMTSDGSGNVAASDCMTPHPLNGAWVEYCMAVAAGGADAPDALHDIVVYNVTPAGNVPISGGAMDNLATDVNGSFVMLVGGSALTPKVSGKLAVSWAGAGAANKITVACEISR